MRAATAPGRLRYLDLAFKPLEEAEQHITEIALRDDDGVVGEVLRQPVPGSYAKHVAFENPKLPARKPVPTTAHVWACDHSPCCG